MHLDAALPARVKQILTHTGVDRDFLVDGPLRLRSVERFSSVLLDVRLTSYRSLPLSCIAGIELAIDGAAIDLRDARIGISGVFHRLDALASLTGVFWFILDNATLVVPLPQPLAAGLHQVAGVLRTVEPYITAGRFVFCHTSERAMVAVETAQ